MLALVFDEEAGAFDLAFADGQLVTDGGIHAAVVASLFTDKRDPTRPAGDQGGWWGAEFDAEDATSEMGSLLWTLHREPPTETTRGRAQKYAEDSLQWLLDDGLADSVDVTATWTMRDGIARLDLRVTCTKADDIAPVFDRVWEVYSGA